MRSTKRVIKNETRNARNNSERTAATQHAPARQKKRGRHRQASERLYIRPSAAIERGGGFFIPGLEGAKLRIALGGGLLVLSGLSIAASGDAPLAVRVSECVAAFASAGVVLPYVLPSTEAEDELAAYRGGAPVVTDGAPADAAWACGAVRAAFPDAAFVALVDGEGRVLCAERTPPAAPFGRVAGDMVRRRDAPALFDALGLSLIHI